MVVFFVVAFTFSWALWLPVAAVEGELTLLHQLAVGVAAVGPSLAGGHCSGLCLPVGLAESHLHLSKAWS